MTMIEVVFVFRRLVPECSVRSLNDSFSDKPSHLNFGNKFSVRYVQEIMKSTKNVIAYTLFLLILINGVNGQSSSPADEYLRQADEFKKNMKPDSAVELYEKAAVEFQKLGNTEKFIYSYNQIGIILTRQDKYEKARAYLEKALSAGLASLEANYLATATTYISLGVVYAAQENFDQSLIYHHQALSIRLARLGEYDGEVATSYGNIGNVYRRKKDFDKSIDAHLKAMKIREKVFGETSVEIGESYTGLGHAYREKKDYQTSLAYFEKALKNKIKQRGEGHKDLVRFYTNISEVYYLMGNKEQGELYKTKSEEISKN
jgi:tetratricopeptide (TPR) repeat protein